jgi:hypothetical protein
VADLSASECTVAEHQSQNCLQIHKGNYVLRTEVLTIVILPRVRAMGTHKPSFRAVLLSHFPIVRVTEHGAHGTNPPPYKETISPISLSV